MVRGEPVEPEASTPMQQDISISSVSFTYTTFIYEYSHFLATLVAEMAMSAEILYINNYINYWMCCHEHLSQGDSLTFHLTSTF